MNTLKSKWTEFPDVERYLWFDWDHPEYLWFKYVVPSGDGGVIGRRTRGEGPKWLRFGESGLVTLRERASLLQRGRPVTFVEGVSDLGPFQSNAWAMGGSAGVEYAKEYIEKWEPSTVTLAMDADSAGKQFVKDLALFCIKRGIPVFRNDYVSGGDPASSPLCGVTRLDSLKRILEESRIV